MYKQMYNNAVEEELEYYVDISVYMSTLRANQKTLDFLKENLSEMSVDDKTDWELDDTLDDFILDVDFSISTRFRDELIGSSSEWAQFIVDEETGEINLYDE